MDLTFLNKLNDEISEHFGLVSPVSDIVANGAVHRFDSTKTGDKAVWVCIHENEFKGNMYYNAVYGSWRQGVQYTCTSYDKDAQTQSKEFRQSIKKQMETTKENLEREKQEKYKACREKWTPYYYGLIANSPIHDYLKNKKISSNFHARIDKYNVLIVPAWNSDGLLVGAQRIFLDPETNKFEKRYTYGIEKQGSFCPFGDVRNAEFVYICEGFATAASVYMGFKNQKNVAVVSVWDTSNLLAGAQAVRRMNPNSYLIFAADKDINSDPKWHNIGERKAKYASNKLSNSIVRTVKFNGTNDKWSDYNDLHQFEGLDKVIAQLHADESEFVEIIPLGFDDDKYYYFSSSKKQILKYSSSDHNPTKMTLDAPAKYWGDRYGYVKNKEGENTLNPNWKVVIEKLGVESSKCGMFNHSKIRGIGAWEHKKDILVNIGDKLYYKNELFPLFNNGIDSEFFYQSGESIAVDFSRPLGNSDMLKFVEAFQMLKYKNPSDYIIALGWIFSAQIFAALPWRPHIWFTGPRGSGKSTVLNYINDAIFSSLLTQDSTASGIRQEIKNDAICVVSDEAEPNTEKDRAKLNEVLLLARQSSTRSNSRTLRGSASGKSVSYNTNTCFCMGSIQLSSMGGADTSRFFVIEMEHLKNQTHEEFVRIENSMAEIKDLSSGLFVRAVNMYQNHITNIELAKKVIKEKRIEARQADQLAPIIAGYWAFFSVDLMDEQFVLNTIKELDFEHSVYAEANEINDSEKCLDDIFGLQIPGRAITVGQMVSRYPYETNGAAKDEYDNMLGLIGLKYLEQEKSIFVSARSSALKNQMERFSDFSDYSNVLKRHDNFIENRRLRVDGSQRKGLIIRVN